MVGRRTLEEFFLELSLCNFNLDRLVNLLVVAALVVGIVLDGGGEEGVDESRLSKARFAGNLKPMSLVVYKDECLVGAYHDGEGSSTFRDDLVSVQGQVYARWLVASRRTAGWEAKWTCQQEERAALGWKIRTLAMPIGERESAMAWFWGCDLVEAGQTKSSSCRCTVTAAPERAGWAWAGACMRLEAGSWRLEAADGRWCCCCGCRGGLVNLAPGPLSLGASLSAGTGPERAWRMSPGAPCRRCSLRWPERPKKCEVMNIPASPTYAPLPPPPC